MVVVAQLVRAPDCGSGGRRFEPGLPPGIPKEHRDFLFNNRLLEEKMKTGREVYPDGLFVVPGNRDPEMPIGEPGGREAPALNNIFRFQIDGDFRYMETYWAAMYR